jgi:RNase adaptor protein for sRNA GlmZ degradation
MKINIYSFGHDLGIPEFGKEEIDFYNDVRHLKKIKTGLKECKPGTDIAIRRKFMKNDDIKIYYNENILEPIIKILEEKKKINYNIIVGCHKGHHKSVCIIEQLYKDLKKRKYKNIYKEHLSISE